MLRLTSRFGNSYADWQNESYICPFCSGKMEVLSWKLDDGSDAGCWAHEDIEGECSHMFIPLEMSHRLMMGVVDTINHQYADRPVMMRAAMTEMYIMQFEIVWR